MSATLDGMEIIRNLGAAQKAKRREPGPWRDWLGFVVLLVLFFEAFLLLLLAGA